jgi:hypothetical protein
MKHKILSLLILTTSLTGCSTHTKEILIGGIVAGGIGAGVGYTVVHHGNQKQYETRNTLITSGVFALLAMGLMAYHYTSLDDQKVEIMSKFTRPTLLKDSEGGALQDGSVTQSLLENEVSASPERTGKYSLELDHETRWVYPSFRKRMLRPESSGNELLSSRYTWEIVRPGFFVTREQQPNYFGDEKPSEKPSKVKTSEKVPEKADESTEKVSPDSKE